MHQYYSDMGNSKITLYQGDCLEYFSQVPTGSVDLIVTDPPYQIDNTKAGGKSRLCKRIQSAQDELTGSNLTEGFDKKILDEMLRVCKAPNLYIWCNGKQIPMYLDYFVKEHGCTFDILIWAKTNAVPAFNNKYLTDKEYCLYFRRGGVLSANELRACQDSLVPADQQTRQRSMGTSYDQASEYNPGSGCQQLQRGGHRTGLFYGKRNDRRGVCQIAQGLYRNGTEC